MGEVMGLDADPAVRQVGKALFLDYSHSTAEIVNPRKHNISLHAAQRKQQQLNASLHALKRLKGGTPQPRSSSLSKLPSASQ
jgi:hypothetical protein